MFEQREGFHNDSATPQGHLFFFPLQFRWFQIEVLQAMEKNVKLDEEYIDVSSQKGKYSFFISPPLRTSGVEENFKEFFRFRTWFTVTIWQLLYEHTLWMFCIY